MIKTNKSRIFIQNLLELKITNGILSYHKSKGVFLVAIRNVIPIILIASLSACNSDNGVSIAQTNSTNETATPQTSQTNIGDTVSQKDVVQIALSSADHTTLVAALKQAELVDVLKKSGPFTVFAPTNEAFDKLPKGTVEDLLKPEKKEKLADILEYHVSVGIYKEDMLQEGQSLGQVNSQNIKISKIDGKIKVNGTANVIGVVPASNGLIYIIDQVLLPPTK